MPQLINLARADATFDTVPMYDESTVTVQIPSIKVDKTADMETWIGDELTYTILVENIEETGGPTATDMSFTDTIDPTLATLVEGSVTVNGSILDPADYTFDIGTGVLTIPSLEDIEPGEIATISFRIKKA